MLVRLEIGFAPLNVSEASACFGTAPPMICLHAEELLDPYKGENMAEAIAGETLSCGALVRF